MRCKSCDYPLWDVRARVCPECGTAFAPSRFEFIQNSVRFCCPHCDQAYYGTGENGRLEPGAFVCVRCARAVTIDEMVVRQRAEVREEHTRPDAHPWENRGTRGFFRAWFGTVMRGMGTPGRLLALTPMESGFGRSFWFLVCTCVLVIGLGALPAAILAVVLVLWGPGGGVGLMPIAVFAGAGLGFVVGVVLLVLLWIGVTHLLLRLIATPAGGIGRTGQCICYSSGPLALVGIPCVGPYIAVYVSAVWWPVSAVLAIKEGQRVTWWRAMIAGATPPLLAAVALVSAYIATIAFAVSASQSIPMTGGPGGIVGIPGIRATQSVISLSSALNRYPLEHRRQNPPHALALADGTRASVDDFVLDRDSGSTTTVMVAGMTLLQYQILPAEQQERLVDVLAANLPAGEPHRVGDVWFVYAGVDLSDPNPGVWTLLAREPGSSPPRILVGLANGWVTTIAESSWTESLADQNSLRASLGLPQIAADLLDRPAPGP